MKLPLLIALLALTGCASTPAVATDYQDGAVHVITISGTSMVPAAWPGDKVLLGNCPYADLKIGFIVLRQFPDLSIPVLHRIVAGNSRGWITQGDSNDRPDRGWLTPKTYLGSALAVIQPNDSICSP